MASKIGKIIRIVVVSVVCVGLIVGYYYYLSHRNPVDKKETTDLSEVDKLITKDLDQNYPTSPRAVVKMYNRIAVVLYNRDYKSDSDMKKLAKQQMILLDDDLVKANPEEVYIDTLKKQIEEYETREESIVSTSVCDSDDVLYKTVKGDECAYVTAYYFGKEGSNYTRTYQKFCLRKDEEGRWKILTFELVEGEEGDFN